jgi:ABC-type polysaccharide/polyol phosphate export permease
MNPTSGLRLALADVMQGMASIHVWSALGWQDVVQRYRRSLLGPLWLTLSTGIMVAIMGPLYGKLFNQDIASYFANLAVGFVLWQMVSGLVIDSCAAFVSAEGYIKQVKLPLSIHVLRVVWKNLIIFFHNMLVVVAVLAYVRPPLTPGLLLFPVALAFFALNGFLFGTIIGIVSARFRDIPMIVANIVQAAFFLTPIIWQPAMLGRHQWAVNLNPFYHFIEIMRAPLLGAPPNPWSWPAVAAITLLGCLLTLATLSRYRARIAYWV